MKTNINWFPGHMAKSLNELKLLINKINLLVILIDARAPKTTFINTLNTFDKNKILLVIVKIDYVPFSYVNKWKKYYSNQDYNIIALNLRKHNSKKIFDDYLSKNLPKVVVPKVIITGIPNIGKSTFLNMITNKKSAETLNKPGVTKLNKWYNSKSNYLVMDTPGILPSRIENHDDALKLVLLNAVKISILPKDGLQDEIIDFLEKLNFNYKIFIDNFGNINLEKLIINLNNTKITNVTLD